jgi:threonine/homoserine/homoserine lactone efflux protein
VLPTLAGFVAVSVVVICTPGQDTALTIRSTLTGGRRSGIATAAGVALGQAVWTLAASAGVVALLSAGYLVFLGVQSLYAVITRRGRDSVARRERQLDPRRALRQGLLSNLGNPKMAVFFTSLLPQFAPGGSFVALLLLGILFCVMTLAWLALYALAVARARSLIAGRVRRALDAITGVVLVAFGLRLAAESK